jgi:hypothetical protein
MKLLSLLVLLTLSSCQNPSRIQAACLMDFMMTLSLHVPPNAARAGEQPWIRERPLVYKHF